MQALIPLTTAVAILLHALIGCCLHHDHCCADDGHTASTAAVAEHGSACSHERACSQGDGHEHREERPAGHSDWPHDCGDHSELPASSHEGPHQCEGSECAFVLGGVSAFVLDLDVHWIGSDGLRVADGIGAVKAVACGVLGDPPPPLAERLQSQYCIWLI